MPRQYTIHKENDLLQQNEISKVILYLKNKHQKEAISHKDASALQEDASAQHKEAFPSKTSYHLKKHIIILTLLFKRS